jgi:hypothetical protein
MPKQINIHQNVGFFGATLTIEIRTTASLNIAASEDQFSN